MVTRSGEQHVRRQAGPVDGFGSYPPEEVTFLVKDLSNSLVEVSRTEYDQRIDQGGHYADMLPEEEYRPTAEALSLFEHALARSARRNHAPPGVASSRCPKDHPETSDSRPRQCTPPGGRGRTPGASTWAPLRWM